MKPCLLFLIIVAFIFNTSFSQATSPVKAFHSRFSICHFNATTETNYSIILFSDSTIRITKFIETFCDKSISVLKLEVSGVYISSGDTLYVSFFSRNSEHMGKYIIPFSNSIDNDLFLQNPSRIYILTNNFIAPLETNFPRLKKTTIDFLSSIDRKYNNLNKKPAFDRTTISFQ